LALYSCSIQGRLVFMRIAFSGLFPNVFHPSTSLAQLPPNAVTSIIDGLNRLYIEKLKPLEVTYRFNDFVSPLMVSRLDTSIVYTTLDIIFWFIAI
jgi:hypothetical protein